MNERVELQIEVVGAVIVRDDRVLCARRGTLAPLPNLWEFPGGKVEPGESLRAALRREINEELRCTVQVGDQIERTTHTYDFATITLTTFYCDLLDGFPQLTEHAEFRWSTPGQLSELDWAPADVPAVRKVQQDLDP